jgi:hypothetical protein
MADRQELRQSLYGEGDQRHLRLGVLIFIHPQGTAQPSTSGRLKRNGVLDNVIGNTVGPNWQRV